MIAIKGVGSMKKWTKGFIALTVGTTTVIAYTVYKFTSRPSNNPKHFKGRRVVNRIVACLGDSNTQGSMAHNFVNDLDLAMKDEGYEFINAGVNGDLVYNVLNRLDEVIACHPDYIIILIGTNDILAGLTKYNEIKFELKKQLPIKPNEAWFISNLTAVIDQLKKKTNAKIAIMSLPLISEDTQSVAFQKAIEYSQQIYKIAVQESITYLPLNEWQLQYLQKHRPIKREPVNTSPFAFFIPSFKHYVLRKSWEEISEEAGLILTIDTVHQNKVAASMIEALVRTFLIEEGEEPEL